MVLERFERQAPVGVMAREALEHAFPAGWVDEVFEAHRERRYARELLPSTVVELMTLVSLGLRPSLLVALPPECWTPWHGSDPERLLSPARRIDPRGVATSKREPKPRTPKGYGDGKTARSHVATARVLAQARTRP